MFQEFRALVMKSNALVLAIGIIIGHALGAVVNPPVEDMPPLALLPGGIGFALMQWVLKDTGDPTTTVAIRSGTFIQTVIQPIVIALAVFIIGKALIREEPPAPAGPPEEVELLAEVRDELRKG